jgi:hypothetical protein
MDTGSKYVRNVSVSYKLARPGVNLSMAETGLGKTGLRPYVELDVVDYIDPTLKSAIAATVMVQQYRAVAKEILAQAWQSAIIKEFISGPGRWAALSPRYASWKRRQKFWSVVKTQGGANVGKKVSRWASGIADLTLSGKLRHNVFHGGRTAITGGAKAANPSYSVDVVKQFKSTPYVWLHEFGSPARHLPMRDFIRKAQADVAPAMAGIAVNDVIIMHQAMQGVGVTAPKRRRYTSRGGLGSFGGGGTTTAAVALVKTGSSGGISWGWLGRWFSHPYWWVVPPSKAFLYMGIASDIRSILTRGLDIERMLVPFVSAWGLGVTGARLGIPLTKKTARRKTRRGIWSR